MASGKKNYFRHSFYASKDDKIVDLITRHGKQAYFHYFRLLELCGEQAAEKIPEKFVFHRRTLCAELMVSNSKLSHHLLAMQSSLLLHVVLSDRKVEVLVPNFSKFLGVYQSKIPSKSPNKRKEKKRKINKTPIFTDAPRSDDGVEAVAQAFIDRLNAVRNLTGRSKMRVGASLKKLVSGRLREGYGREDLLAVVDHKAAEWLNTEMEKYLRPETLLRPSKFEAYAADASKPDSLTTVQDELESLFKTKLEQEKIRRGEKKLGTVGDSANA